MKELNKNPCSICEIYMEGYECETDENKCPIAQMKEENKALKEENKRLKAAVEKLTADAGWDFEMKCQEQNRRIYEMGEL